MSGGCRVNGQRPSVPDIGGVIEQLERVDEPCASLATARQFEPDQRALAAFEVFVGIGLEFAGLQRGVIDRDDLRTLCQPGGDFFSIGKMSVDTQRQRFDTLNGEESVERRLKLVGRGKWRVGICVVRFFLPIALTCHG